MSSSLFQIRATRSNPPGRAGEDERRKTYGAALAQFDELMAAARAVGPAARPLPLFYALSQAGRAITAAHAEGPWRLYGHGLAPEVLSVPLLDVAVGPDSRKSRSDAVDSFRGVARATGGETPSEPVSLRELWSSLPEAFELLHDPLEAIPVLLVPTVPDGKLHDWTRAQASVVGFPGRPDDVERYLKNHFPSTMGVNVDRAPTVPGIATVMTKQGIGVPVSWPASGRLQNHIEALNRVAPGTGLEARWLRPGVGGVELSPLMTWWMLLFGLSMLARYQPDVWMDALQYDASPVAAGLAQLLEVGCEQMPQLVLDALKDEVTTYLAEH